MKRLFKNYIGVFSFLLLCIIVLAFSLRGVVGNPTAEVINKPEWKEDGPFELSPERGRFALTLSVVEDNSFHFSVPIARFATPDLGYKDGNYVSLFAPGVSFIIIPGYLLGRAFDLGQVGPFAVISLFAILNALLIRKIALQLKAHPTAAIIGAFAFLFATPAFTYGVSLFQHHISTFLILSAIYTVLKWNNLRSLALVWFLFAAAVPVDYPNLFLMFPIAVYALGKMIYVRYVGDAAIVNIKIAGFLTFVAVIFPLAFFLWFNQASFNNPLQLSGTLQSVNEIDENGKMVPPEELVNRVGRRYDTKDLTRKKTATAFFKTRNLLNGFYIHFLSPDRGIIRFTPVVFFSLFGMYFLYRKDQKVLALLLGIIGVDILFYSMWGDPWGGWAFGSRYLIPGYAVAAIFISLALTALKRNIIFLSTFFLVAAYSVFVNELGAITTSANPPQVEVLELEKLSGLVQKYTYERNWDYLISNRAKSFIWQAYAKNWVSALQYFEILFGLLVLANLSLIIALWRKDKGSKGHV